MQFEVALSLWSAIYSTLRQRAVWHREAVAEGRGDDPKLWLGIEVWERFEGVLRSHGIDAMRADGLGIVLRTTGQANHNIMRCIVSLLRAIADALEKGHARVGEKKGHLH